MCAVIDGGENVTKYHAMLWRLKRRLIMCLYGLLAGLIIGVPISIVLLALCDAASWNDNHLDANLHGENVQKRTVESETLKCPYCGSDRGSTVERRHGVYKTCDKCWSEWLISWRKESEE